MGYFILLLAILFPWMYGEHEAQTDYEKITADAGNDSLKERFHSNNLLIRGSAIGIVAAVLTVAVHWLLGFPYWYAVPYLLYCSAVFGYVFSTKLNLLRGLPKFYVSRDPRASKTDRLQVHYAAKLGITPATFSAITYTAFLIAGTIILLVFLIFFWAFYTSK